MERRALLRRGRERHRPGGVQLKGNPEADDEAVAVPSPGNEVANNASANGSASRHPSSVSGREEQRNEKCR
jgi:hypothetical protein